MSSWLHTHHLTSKMKDLETTDQQEYEAEMTRGRSQMRVSETEEQREYEKEVLKGSFPVGHYEEKSALESSLENKVKGLWTDIIKPAFPEAVQDVTIMKNALTIDGIVVKQLGNVQLYPEVARTAEVRRGLDLSRDETAFLAQRKVHVRNHFAKYLGLDPAQVHPDDVPIVSFGGSGGGYRAMIAVLSYCNGMKESGLWDVLTYVAGVSGSCWALSMYYTFGGANMAKLIDHCKTRLGPYHPLSEEGIRKVLTAPGGPQTTWGPLVEKHYSGLHNVAMDLYAVFTVGYLFLHEEPILKVDVPGSYHKNDGGEYTHTWWKWSSAARYLERGAEPLPILSAVRHERPWKDWVDKEHPFTEPDHYGLQHTQAQDAWFQWFEMTPFEIGCDEIEAWVPTWAFGRPYLEGKSTKQLPEQSLSLLLGLATSAPAGPLQSYIATINRNLPKGIIGNTIHQLASTVTKYWGRQGTEEFNDHHPLHACNEYNFMYHVTKVPQGQVRPPGLENSPHIHLIDSGMDNNCPTYVLLHPSREVDVIINMDASSDVEKDSFPERVDQIGLRRGIKYTPRQNVKAGTDPKDPDRFKGLYGQIYDGTFTERPATIVNSYGDTVTNPPAPICHHESTVVYLPLLPNERAVPDFDPSTAKFSGSYNLVWTPEQVEMLVNVCAANFKDAEGAIKTALREAWLKKKAKREASSAGSTHPGRRY